MKRLITSIILAALAYALFLVVDVAEGVPSNQWVLSQLGLAFNQTAGEITASVTPTLYGYEPGNAWRYGCKANINQSGSDSVPCLQATANASSAMGITAYIPGGGQYYVKTRWNCPANGVVLKGDGWNLTTAGQGTWIHVVTAQFQTGGPQQGNHPFQCGSSAAVNFFEARDIAFTEDQPADTGGWTPTAYAQGAMWIFSNGSYMPRFIHTYFAGVNQAINFHSVQGYVLDDNYFQIFTTGVLIDHNSDWNYTSRNTFQDAFCSTTNCPNITAYSQANAVGFQSNRNDDPSFVENTAFGLFALLAFGTDASGVTTNARVSDMDCDKCFHTVYITAAGASAQIDQARGHTFNFAGNAALRGGDIVFESGGTAVLQISNLRSQNTGDAAINLTGTGDDVKIVNSYLFSWGQNSTANGTCDSAVFAVNAGASNTVRISNTTFSPGGCSTKTYSPSNSVIASNGQFGNWTPGLLFGGSNTGLTTSAASGEYQVNDHEVSLQFVLALTAVGSSTGSATITGAPFAANGSGNWGKAGWGSCADVQNMSTLTSPIILQLPASGTTFSLMQQGAAALTAMTNANFTNTSILRCRFTYFQ